MALIAVRIVICRSRIVILRQCFEMAARVVKARLELQRIRAACFSVG
jgi:hypothetical protein